MNRRHFLAAAGLAALPGRTAAVASTLPPHMIEARDQILGRGKLGKVSLLEVTCYGDRAAGARLFREAVQMLGLGGLESSEPQAGFGADAATFYYPGLLVAWNCRSTGAQQAGPPMAVFYGDRGTMKLSASNCACTAAPAETDSNLRFA